MVTLTDEGTFGGISIAYSKELSCCKTAYINTWYKAKFRAIHSKIFSALFAVLSWHSRRTIL